MKLRVPTACGADLCGAASAETYILFYILFYSLFYSLFHFLLYSFRAQALLVLVGNPNVLALDEAHWGALLRR